MSSSSIQLIVGLGNPGKEYLHTRHNAGAWFVAELANKASVTLRHETKYHGMHAVTQLHQHACHLLIPTTFMNNSGQAVHACMNYHKISPPSLLIVHDEIDLPAGTVRLKYDGGDGGHNGLKDIIRHLSTKQFYRLRIGVGHPGNSKDVVDYVLHLPSKADRANIEDAMQRAQEVLPLILAGQLQQAMHQLHTNEEKNV